MSTESMPLPASAEAFPENRPGRATRRLRLMFLVPLFVVILMTVMALVGVVFVGQVRSVDSGVIELQTTAPQIYEQSVQHDAEMLRALADVLGHDEILKAALARRDRQALLDRAGPIFEDVKRDLGVTHLYFTGPDRVNLLRVHQPERYGDVIDRVTTLMAESSAKVAYGVELGPLGTLTLRLVAPWRDDRTGALLGYVEVGTEINNVLDMMSKFLGADIFVLIRKEFVDRLAWEEGMRLMGRTPEWDRFSHFVLSTQSRDNVPTMLTEHLTKSQVTSPVTTWDLVRGRGRNQQLIVPMKHHPLRDVGGRVVAEMTLLVDMSKDFDDARKRAFVGASISSLSGAALVVLFYWLVGRVGRRIEHDEQMLSDLANRDGLTKLYNHSKYYALLEQEVARAKRYGRPVSLLMIDIDHFKHVNDSYGHIAGDHVLQGLARVLERSVRQVDSVCRCGGEEIGIILPEMPAKSATQAAERLRAEIERATFDLGDGRKTGITVSIGVASLPEQSASLEELTRSVDNALYAAKRSGRNQVCQAS